MTAQERLDLGMSHFEEGRFDEAIKALSSVHREETDSITYAWAQLGLGFAYNRSGKLDEAIEALSNISHGDTPGVYAWAQLGLGAAYKDQGKLDEAIKIWSNISHGDTPGVYAWAQLSLGNAYKDQGKLDEAIKIWSNISHGDTPGVYAWAQLSLGNTYKDQGKLDQAIATWSNITQDDNRKIYTEAQHNIGKFYEDKGDLEQAKEAYCNAQDFSYYNYERVTRILNCPPELINDLHSLAKNTDKVRESLQVIPKFESKVAHYSRPSTAFSLFGDEKNNKNPSNFRLSTIRGVNDPSEGLVLRDYWDQQGIPETIHTSDTATFVSCFTFNHDSLNQFRLYGKEDDREATGVSLVFKKEFFSEDSGVLKHIVGVSSGPSNKSGDIESSKAGTPENNNKKQLIVKSALYRCIYLDPETGYWTLAQRDKSNFYRQHKEKAEKKWKKYYKSLSKKEKSVNKHLFAKDKSILSTLQSIFKKYQGYSTKEKQYILEAVRFILLPLQYLVKHIAFQEEQECRIMYITQFRDEKIHSNREKQKMYVEYEESVLPHIDKIYLSPGAAKDQDFFRILLDQGSGKSKVRISQNPFRNKE